MSHARSAVRVILCSAIAVVLSGLATPLPAQTSSGPAAGEAALRKRVADFYGLMRLRKSAEAEAYVTSDTLDEFRIMPNGEFVGASIRSLELAKDSLSATVMIDLVVSSAAIPVPFQLPRKTSWKLEDGLWKIAIPAQSMEQSGVGIMFPHGGGQAVVKPPETDLKFPSPTAEIPRIKQGEKKLVTYSFRNAAKHPVSILEIKSDCTCIVLKSGKRTFQPDEAGELTIEFDSSGHVYRFSQSIVVRTDPGKQEVRLLLAADIAPNY